MSENGNGNSGTEIVKRPIAANGRGLVLRSLDDLWRFVCYVHKSQLAPKSLATKEQIFVAIQMGAELGLAPMRSLSSIAVISGRPSLYGDAALALVKASGMMEYCRESTEMVDGEMVAYCKTKRKDEPEVVTLFSVADARRAKLWGKAGPWQDYPQRMLKYRARGFNLRDNFPDVLCGMHLVEEMQDLPPDAPEPSEAAVDVPTREERRDAKTEVVDVTPEEVLGAAPPTPLNRAAAAVTVELRKSQLVVDDELVLEILPKLAARACHGTRHMYTEDEAWTPEVTEKCLAMLEEHGIDPDWLPAEPAEVSSGNDS